MVEARVNLLRKCDILSDILSDSSGQDVVHLLRDLGSRQLREIISKSTRAVEKARAYAERISADAEDLDAAVATVKDVMASLSKARAEAAAEERAAAARRAAAAEKSANLREIGDFLEHGHLRPRGGSGEDGNMVVKADPAELSGEELDDAIMREQVPAKGGGSSTPDQNASFDVEDQETVEHGVEGDDGADDMDISDRDYITGDDEVGGYT